MTEKYSFFGSAEGDIREYDQIDYAEVYKRFIKTGVFPSVENELAVAQTVPARLAVQVTTGQAYIEGYWYGNTSIREIDLPVADAVNPRIDRIVLRLDVVNERKITAEYLKGTAAVAPVVPSLTRTDQIYEISLAQIRVNAGATSLLNVNITDERNNQSLCGWAVPPITNQQVIDVTKLFGLGGNAKNIDNTALNSLTETGFYVGTNLTNNPNGVMAEVWEVEHINISATGAIQKATAVTSQGKSYFRQKAAGTWGVWHQLIVTDTSTSWTPITLPIITGFESSDSGSTANRWAKFATVEMNAQYAATNGLISIMGGNSGAGSTINAFALIKVRVKQQDALGISPRVGIDIIGNNSIEPNDIVAVTTENTANKTKVELYVKVNTSYEVYTWAPLHVRGDRNLTIHNIPSYVNSLPAGSQVTGRGPIGHAAYMSKSSQANIAPSTRTKVGLDSGLAYGDMVISTASNRFTVPKDGSYQVSAVATVYIESNKYAELSLYKNGSLYRHIGRTEATNTAYQQITGIDIAGAFAGDYFELYVYHNGAYSAAALNFRITMTYIGGLL